MWIFDAHLDLSMNAIEWNRDLTMSVAELRASETGQTDKTDRAKNTVSLPDMRRGRIGICVATQIARVVRPANRKLINAAGSWHSPEIAWSMTQGQLAWYKAMEEAGEMVQITDLAGLNKMVELWQNDPPPGTPIGYILSLEGADSIRTPKHLVRAYEQGLRAIGPVHYGPGRYGFGTHSDGGIPPVGVELLQEIERLGMILDATHLCDKSFWDAMKNFNGHVWASHSNARAVVPHERQFDDEQLKELIKRGAVIGAVLDAWMVVPNWTRGKTTVAESGVKLAHLVEHIDHICQLAGNAKHCGIGSDLDGGYGTEQSPGDLDTIADLQHLSGLLSARGYSEADIEGIFHGNFLRFLRNAWK